MSKDPGYNKLKLFEPLILESRDHNFISWFVIKKLFGFKLRDRVSIIKVTISKLEYFIDA